MEGISMIKEILEDVRKSGRKTLDEYNASRIMSEAGIPMAKGVVCKDLDSAIKAAEYYNYPVVIKIASPNILHKTDVGCVKVGIKNKTELTEAYYSILDNATKSNPDAHILGVLVQEMVPQGLELIAGMKRDPQFGPVLMFGMGGIYVEAFQDVALRLIPITRADAVKMIKETRVYKIIQGLRGKEYDLEQVIQMLLKISDLVAENDLIEEIDINPFFLYEKGKGGKGVDALISIR
jgi:acyl-CoA synthetase (NDP forming)